MSRFAIGHILIKSNHLHQAVKEYEKAGFTVTYRTDPAKAHNALIYMKDGSFLELYNPNPVRIPDKLVLGLLRLFRPLHSGFISRYMSYIKSDEGLNDYALDSIPLEQAEENLSDLIQAGVDIGKKINMSKRLLDGSKQKWWMAMPQEVKLPFLMSAYNPAVICTEYEITHNNGALGIDKLVIEVPELEEWIMKYAAIFKGASLLRDGNQCEFTLGKTHKILLRQAEQYRISEIHMLTSKRAIPEHLLRLDLPHKTAIILKSI
ncbi:VOC family protein [Paenibacillus sp. GSMTC-2017]|uniref:VOC family protein n=1 Tax=Paenibacillus sp. GSMTC-2017 TaxID=2794350 RepID=UPI0018D5BB45|nr:VOC family protein [Paenibacillus sp. GSMTC-2017]MBH5319532.1 VOC family protein [Paenibacillus sp. GSMTC-2017]